MLIRALIVLLAVLNVGVAAWWLTRPEAAPPPLPEVPLGVATLELVKTPDLPSPTQATAPVPVADAAPARCLRLGPYATQALADAARAQLAGAVTRVAQHEVPGAGASGYRVLLPPAASREDAVAAAERIRAAGFSDLLVINNGDEANSVALGRYRSREGALRRQAELGAAGFTAEIRAIGRDAGAQWWLDVGASPAATDAALRETAGAAQALPQDCAALR